MSLSAALYAADGATAKDDLGVEDLESRIKAQVGLWCNIVGAAFVRFRCSQRDGVECDGRPDLQQKGVSVVLSEVVWVVRF